VYLASRLGIVSDFIALSPFGGANPVVAQRVRNVVIQAGAVYGGGWLNGEWWLLLTSCFIHIGAMHILANMYALYRVGGEVERMWGSVRYLVIYLFAGLGGSCLALGLAPRGVMAGASGAICGVLGAEAVWVLCNGRHLPRLLARELRRNLLINGVLITFISLMPGVSWQGHLGGAVIGAAVALVMQVQRFGPPPLRWPILLALVPLPWMGLAFIKYERATNPEWARVAAGQADDEDNQEEVNAFQNTYLQRIQNETNSALEVYGNAGVLDRAPEERNPAEVAKVKHALGEQREIIKQLAADLTAAGPYKNRVAENARRKALALTEAVEDLLTTAETRLREGEEWTAADQTKSEKVKEAVTEWRKLLK
jgi:membrane associated rhomboid family serine protease